MPEVPRYPYDKLTPEHVEAIGLIIIQWANAEKAFTHILARLVAGDAGDADMALVSVTGMRDRPITGLIKSIFRLKYPDRADAFDRLIDRLLRDGKRRDGIAHAWWLKGNRPGSIHAGIARPANVFGLDEYDYTAPELRALANRIEAKLIELIRFMKPYGVFVVPSPEKPS